MDMREGLLPDCRGRLRCMEVIKTMQGSRSRHDVLSVASEDILPSCAMQVTLFMPQCARVASL